MGYLYLYNKSAETAKLHEYNATALTAIHAHTHTHARTHTHTHTLTYTHHYLQGDSSDAAVHCQYSE